MASITEVKVAMSRDDRIKATQLLTEVLRSKQSAEAWYLAAELSNNEDKIKTYLRRSLLLDKNYQPAREMLARVKGQLTLQRSGVGQILRDEMKASKQDDKTAGAQAAASVGQAAADGDDEAPSPRPAVPMLVQQVLLGLLVVIFLGLAINLLTGNGDDDPAAANNAAGSGNSGNVVNLPAISELPELERAGTQRVLAAFQQAGYAAQLVVPDDFSQATEKYAMRVPVEGGSSFMLLYVYEQPTSSQQARTIFENLDGYGVDRSANLVLAIPDGMDEFVADEIRLVFLDVTQIQ